VGNTEALLAFTYHRALAPLLWVFAGIMAVELLVTHLIVMAVWSDAVALILSAIGLGALIWTISFTVSLKRLPVLVAADGVTMRIGSLKSVQIPADHIAELRAAWARDELKRRGVLNFGGINYPNVMLDLDPPLPNGKRSLIAVAHRLDDPAGFAAAVARLAEMRS
jgi:hypothetical protein